MQTKDIKKKLYRILMQYGFRKDQLKIVADVENWIGQHCYDEKKDNPWRLGARCEDKDTNIQTIVLKDDINKDNAKSAMSLTLFGPEGLENYIGLDKAKHLKKILEKDEKLLIVFMLFHEMGHAIRSRRSEKEADIWAYREFRKYHFNINKKMTYWHNARMTMPKFFARLALKLRPLLYHRESQIARLLIVALKELRGSGKRKVFEGMFAQQYDRNFFMRLSKTDIELLIMLINEKPDIIDKWHPWQGLDFTYRIDLIIQDQLLKLSRQNKYLLRGLFKNNPYFFKSFKKRQCEFVCSIEEFLKE